MDIFEGVNQVVVNQQALHTTTGCTLASSAASTMSGTIVSTDCSTAANSNAGCAVTAPTSLTGSYGAAFAANGGGIYAAELATTGIK